MDDPLPEDLPRQLRWHLEGLRLAGLSQVPLPKVAPLPRGSVAAATPPDRSPPVVTPGPPPPVGSGDSTVARPSPSEVNRSPSLAPEIGMAGLLGPDAIEGPALPIAQRIEALEAMSAEVAACTRCELLAAGRTRTVYGVGNPAARLMFIGEAPGADEDRQGIPFVGRAGRLLTDMITKGMRLSRDDVYIANILKCRPPQNRDPESQEAANCIGYLYRQIELVRPECICLLGRIAAQTLLQTAMPMRLLRGKWQRVRGIPTLVTYHPAALLRNPAWKKDAWEDLQMIMREMGLPLPD